MTLRNSVSVVSGALLLAGLGLQQANAQVITFTDIDYALAGTAFTGTNGSDTVAATAGTAVEALGQITDPLTNFSFTGPVGPYTITLTGGSGDLNIIGGVASFSLDPGYTVTGGPLTGLDLTFTPSPSPTVTGTTTVVGGVSVTTGVLSSFTGSASVTNVTLTPEPGTLSLLAGLAVVGSGLGLRRRRRA